jgi:acyl CoA:acetate/3-ketoacid CoA transferase
MRVNYGFGIPGGISAMADKSLVDSCWQMVEQGIHNGQLLDGALFGAAKYPQAIVSSLDQFDLFSGGGLDITFLGMGEMDAEGNVNVSQLGDTIVGPGGFIDITCGAKRSFSAAPSKQKAYRCASRVSVYRSSLMGKFPSWCGKFAISLSAGRKP